MSDLWTLVGVQLEMKELPAFFRVSKVHAKVDERECFWKAVCRKNYGDWEDSSPGSGTWKEFVRQLYFRIKTVKSCPENQHVHKNIRDIMAEHADQFYIRSPSKATFFHGSGLAHLMRDGDVLIKSVSPQFFNVFTFKVGDRKSSIPPIENCWPHKSIDYSHVKELVFIHMPPEDLEKCKISESTEGGYHVELIDPRRPTDTLVMRKIDLKIMIDRNRSFGHIMYQFYFANRLTPDKFAACFLFSKPIE